MNLEYGKVAGIDVHKKWLYVVTGEQRRRVGSTAWELEALRDWLDKEQVQTVVMESTAQYWRPVWLALQERFVLYLAQAQSNRARAGRKSDFLDAERLIRRLEANELVLSFVPAAAQQEWRLLTRQRVEYSRYIGQIRNRMETLLEEGRLKISGFLSDLLGTSGRRILKALAAGETDPRRLAALADWRVRATQEELAAALTGSMTAAQRLLLQQHLDGIEFFEREIEAVSRTLAACLEPYQAAIARLCEIPGLGISAAEQILAEVGVSASSFPSAAHLASWAGVCPGREESAGLSRNNASPRGNRALRRVLTQAAWAAVRSKDSFLQSLFRRLTPRLGIQKALWAVAHRLLRIIWIVLHGNQHYRELGPAAANPSRSAKRLRNLIRELTAAGYVVSRASA